MSTLKWNTPSGFYRGAIFVDFPPSAVFVYRSWSDMSARDPMTCLLSLQGSCGELASDDVIVIGDEAAHRYLLAGAVTAFRSQSFFRVLRRGGRFISIEVDQPSIRAGEEPEEIIVIEGPDWRDLLFQYADIAAKKMGVSKINAKENETGYCTWYYYYKDVTWQDFLGNVEALGRNRSPFAAKYVQIDDGYQRRQGDWLECCETWPDTLENAAAKIKAKCMIPGIWLMPFVASTASRLYERHPDWFVKEMNSDEAVKHHGWTAPPENDWCCLDVTIPEVNEHIASIFKAFWEMGYAYFKLDGLSYGLTDGRRQDISATAVSAFRQLLKTIRETVPDAVLLACSQPFMPCLGYFDNARISCDTSRYFKTPAPKNWNFPFISCDILNSSHLSMNNFWKFDRWFRCDPDVLMARQDNAFYSLGEARISILSGILTGICFTSDRLDTISQERNALLGIAQKYRMRNVRPFHWQTGQWPQLFEGTINGKRAVAVINDSEEGMLCNFSEFGLPAKCKELFTQKQFEKEMTLPFHDAAILME